MRHDRSHDGDFTAYVAARWPTLVRTLVLLGAPQPAAEAATRSALARCRRRWATVGRADDLDAEVYAAVLASWARLRQRVPEPSEPSDTAEPSDTVDRAPLVALEHDLDRLTRAARAAVVLRLVAGLDDRQVATALDVRTPPTAPATYDEERLREAAESVAVLAPPLAQVAAEAGAQRRRTARVVGASAATLLVLVGLATWLGTRSSPAPATSGVPQVTRVENSSEVAWWANGMLHLAHVDVELARVVGMVAIGDGAVYADDRGGVFAVADDGAVTTLGHTDPAGSLVGSDETGWAAWVDRAGDAPKLVVYDVTARAVLATRALVAPGPDRAAPRPIALDRDTVYYEDAAGEWAWKVGDGDPVRLTQPDLLDVVQATQVWQIDDATVQMVQPFFSVAFTARGRGGRLSPTAGYLLTREPGSAGSDQFGKVRIYDTRSGDRLWDGLRRGDIAVATAMGPYDEVHYVIAREQDVPRSGEFVRSSFSGPYELRTCHIGTRSCFTVAQFPHTGQLPVLAR